MLEFDAHQLAMRFTVAGHSELLRSLIAHDARADSTWMFPANKVSWLP